MAWPLAESMFPRLPIFAKIRGGVS
jgi:hypothetical protein